MVFHYGQKRAIELIESLRTYQSEFSLRVNTKETTRQKLIETLESKKIIVKEHPILNDCILVQVAGPNEIKEKSKAVKVQYNKPVHNILIGGSLGAKDIIPISDDMNIGDEVTIKNELGEPLANGILMMSLNDIQNKRKGIAIKTTEHMYEIPNLNALKEFLRGQFIHQNIPSIVVGSQIKLKPKDRILDLNVGRGEILTHIYQNNFRIWEKDETPNKKNSPKIVAIESSRKLTERLNENLKRLRMKKPFFELRELFARKYKDKYNKEKTTVTGQFSFKKFEEKFSRDETFDWIVLNLPSSNIGLRPKLFGNVKERTILSYADKQREYLTQAARLLKPGGVIFYLTNSLDPAENENNIQYAVENLGLKVVKQDINLGSNDVTGFPGAEHLQYFYPDVHNTDGQFIARLTK
jgi:16S rRNA (cytosine967-C5)-methyltransferase